MPALFARPGAAARRYSAQDIQALPVMSNPQPCPNPGLRKTARRRVLLLMAACVLARPAFADEVPAAEVKRIQAVIADQLAAFAADDARRAFGHASPALQRQFGDAQRFMTMVRTSYPVVYRPASVAFLRPELIQGQATQSLHLTDAQGARWLAVYVMERGPAGAPWRIGGCTVVPASGRTARLESPSPRPSPAGREREPAGAISTARA